MRHNFKYSAATFAAGTVTAALLAWCIPHLSIAPGTVTFNDGAYMDMNASTAWLLWRANLTFLIFNAVVAGIRMKKKRPVATFCRWQVLPVLFVLILSGFVHFVLAGNAGFVGGLWRSLAVALIAGQFMALWDNLGNMDFRPAPAAE